MGLRDSDVFTMKGRSGQWLIFQEKPGIDVGDARG
jgi:hypothetical protein